MIAFEIFLFIIELCSDLRNLGLIGTLMLKVFLHLVINVSKLDLVRSRLKSKLRIY